MIVIQDKYLLSDDIVSEQFACNLAACKGACCWEGDMGAPLEKEELDILKEIYPNIKPFLSPKSIEVLERDGLFQESFEGGHETTLIDGGPCAYLTMSGGVAYCGIEKAYNSGATDFRKPISCHLYPIRIKKTKAGEALNYDRWDICSAACTKGKKEKIAVYQFAKDALIRKYGEDFYEELDAVAFFLSNK